MTSIKDELSNCKAIRNVRSFNNDNDYVIVAKKARIESNVDVDVLIRPERLLKLHGVLDPACLGKDALLHYCLDGPPSLNSSSLLPLLSSSLLTLTSSVPFTSSHLSSLQLWLKQMRRKEELTECEEQGRNAMHLLIRGCSKTTFDTVLTAVTALLNEAQELSDSILNAKDKLGHTPITSLHIWLNKDMIGEISIMLSLMLNYCYNEQKVLNNVHEMSRRSLLTYVVSKCDQEEQILELTTKLIALGAQVWPQSSSDHLSTADSLKSLSVNLSLMDSSLINWLKEEREQSSLTWFVRARVHQSSMSVMQSRLLNVLGQEMAKDPQRMRAHVLRVLLNVAKGKGQFLRFVLTNLAKFWSKPSSLQELCIRSLGQVHFLANDEDRNVLKFLREFRAS